MHATNSARRGRFKNNKENKNRETKSKEGKKKKDKINNRARVSFKEDRPIKCLEYCPAEGTSWKAADHPMMGRGLETCELQNRSASADRWAAPKENRKKKRLNLASKYSR